MAYNAYNNYYPMNMNYGQNPYNVQNYQPQLSGATQNFQQGGYITVRSEEEARNYPVALGTSVTFFNETQPFCYKKTMGNSPLDKNDFRIYKITEISDTSNLQNLVPTSNETQQTNKYTIEQFKSEIDNIYGEIEALKKQVAELQPKKRIQVRKTEEAVDNESISE